MKLNVIWAFWYGRDSHHPSLPAAATGEHCPAHAGSLEQCYRQTTNPTAWPSARPSERVRQTGARPAEHLWGFGRGLSDFAYLKASAGIGANLVVNGQLCRGTAGTAGEIGHTTIDENGVLCRCGNRGCLETLAGGPALVAALPADYGDSPTLEDLLRLAQEGDPGCRRLIDDAGRHIGVAVANQCNLFSPALVIVGGELASAGDLLLAPMRESLLRRAVPIAAQNLAVVTSTLAERATVLGAMALALQDVEPDITVLDRAALRVADGDSGRLATVPATIS